MSVRDSVLEALKKNKGNYLSGEKLSGDFGVSRAAVWKAISSLRQEGYRINAVTNRGYVLMEDEGGISEEGIRSFLTARYKGNFIRVYDIADSTNLIARKIASGEDPETDPSADTGGAIIVARQQTAGRGRLGRSFFSPAEGIYMSIIIRPDFDISKHTLITVATAAAVAEAIDEVCDPGEKTKIKWVNDIYLEGKKVCGILTEGITDFESGRIETLVVGIGINTNIDNFPGELKKVAGAVEGDWSRSELIAQIASKVLDHTGRIRHGSAEDNEGDHPFMETYREKSMLIGESVQIYRGTYRQDPAKEMEGIPAKVKDIDDSGGLVVVWSDRSEETLTTGEVSVRTV